MTLTHKDTVIVGGGVAGLTAAILLAQAGQSVGVYEKANAWGGRAMTRIRDGFHLNLGPHAVYRGFSAEKTLTSFGIELQGNPPVIDRHSVAQRKGDIYKLPATPTTMITSKLLSASEKLAYARALLKIQEADLDQLKGESWVSWAERAIPSQRVRAALIALGRITTYANAPEHILASVVLRQLKAVFGEGVLYLDHGWQQIVDALVEKALEVGVDLHLRQVVKSIKWDECWHQVELRDGTVSAENLILAVPPRAAISLLPQSTELAAAVAEQQPVKAACLTLGLRSLPNPKLTYGMGIDRPLYYSLHTAAAWLAPKSEHLVHLAYYRAPNDETSSAEICSELENFMQQMQPGWRDHVVTEEFLPDITVYFALPQVGVARPPVTVEDVPNSYVIGDWVDVDEILADASFSSARVAADAIMARPSMSVEQEVALHQSV